MADPKDVTIVQENWKLASTDRIDLGIEIFARLFASKPTYTTFFRRILSSGGCDASNPRMRQFALLVMSAIGLWIHALTDISVIPGLLYLQGVRHKAMGVTEEHFQTIMPFVYASIERRIGSSFSRRAWNNVFAWIIQGVAQGMQ